MELLDVAEAARELEVDPSRVRALIADGSLEATKIGGRWLVDAASVAARRREAPGPGRPLAARNAWALLIAASGEGWPEEVDAMARWRLRQTLRHAHLEQLRARLESRARVRRLWGLSGELRRLLASDAVVRTGSSASAGLGLGLLAPDAVDGYVAADRIDALVEEYGLEPATAAQANVLLRVVPVEAWVLAGREM